MICQHTGPRPRTQNLTAKTLLLALTLCLATGCDRSGLFHHPANPLPKECPS